MSILTENVELVFASDLQLWHRFYTPVKGATGFAGPFFERFERTGRTVTVHTVNGGERTLAHDELVLVATPSFPTT